jgi:ubiquinone/menaquinone biosynthesis C-methylase UbiE
LSGWNERENARRYRDFEVRHGMYASLGRKLAGMAGIEPGMEVVDLACGTGAVTREILRLLGGSGSVTGVDASEAMLELARMELDDPRVRWVHGRGEELERAVDRPVDRVLCSSALWQMRLPEVLWAVRSVLKPDGAVAFNLPEQFARGLFSPPDARRPAGLAGRMIAVAILEHDYSFLRFAPPPRPAFPDLAALSALVHEAGMRIERHEEIEERQTAEAAHDWLEVPVFTDRMFPDLDYPTRMTILERAYAGYDRDRVEVNRWMAFLCRPDGGGVE